MGSYWYVTPWTHVMLLENIIIASSLISSLSYECNSKLISNLFQNPAANLRHTYAHFTTITHPLRMPNANLIMC
jgi:hypothetical protein